MEDITVEDDGVLADETRDTDAEPDFRGTGDSDCVLGGNISGSSFDEYVWNDPNGVLDLLSAAARIRV